MFGQAILRDTFDPTAVIAVNTRIVSRPPHQTGSRSAQTPQPYFFVKKFRLIKNTANIRLSRIMP